MKTKPTQLQMYFSAVENTAQCDETFFFMANCKENPLTNSDLKKAIERRPELWGRYSGFIGKLAD